MPNGKNTPARGPAEGTTDHDAPTAGDGTPTADAEGAGRRALEAFETPEAQDEWTQQLIDWLRDLFGEPEAPPADLLAMATSSTDGFKAVLTSEGEGDGMPSEADRSKTTDPHTGARTMTTPKTNQDPEKDAELAGLRKRVDDQDQAIREMREREHERSILDHIDARFRDAKLTEPQGEHRDEILRMAKKAGDDWQRIVETYLKAANVPPAGTATDPDARAQRTPAPETTREAIASAKDEIRSEEPDIRKRDLRAKAYARAKERHPELFTAADAAE